MIWLDLETFSEVDIKKVGAYAYAFHPSTEILLFGYAIDDQPAQVWDVASGATMPLELHEALMDTRHKLIAQNCSFDRWVLMAKLPGYDYNLERWVDSMIVAATNGLPLNLDQATHAVLPEDETKLKSGSRLISLFCKPAPRNHKAERYNAENKPEEWAEFIFYCRRDITSMRKLCQILPTDVYSFEHTNWLLNMRMNDRGVPVDLKSCELFIEQVKKATATLNKELANITGGAATAASQAVRILEWANGKGAKLPDLTAGTVAKALDEGTLPEDVLTALDIRQKVAKSSTAKFSKMIGVGAVDGRMHGMFQFYGAFRTGREAGRMVQLQNLPRPSRKPDVISAAIKVLHTGRDLLPHTAIGVASDSLRAMLWGDTVDLCSADLSNIEGRMLAWLAGEEWKLEAFREYDRGEGPDIYKLSFSRSFNKPVDDVDGDDRQIGKVQELALGFGGGAGAFHSMAANYGVTVSDERAEEIKINWRAAHPATRAFWSVAERSIEKAIDNPNVMYTLGAKCKTVFYKEHDQLRVALPSGRHLVYFQPRYDNGALTYMGIDTYTKKWVRITTWGGMLVENITQAAARDVLYHGMRSAEAAGFELIGSVHDEILSLAGPGRTHVELEQHMAIVPEWAEGLPLAAEGWTALRYRK